MIYHNDSYWYRSPLFWEIFFIDWVTKLAARGLLKKPVIIINQFLTFEYYLNTGVAWSFLRPQSSIGYYVLTAVIFLVLGVLAKHTLDMQKEGYDVTGQTLILAGGYGNFVDRLLRHGVVDFIKFSFGPWTFPVFNIADIAISIGAVIMLYQIFFEHD